MKIGIMATDQSVAMLTADTTYVRAMMILWSIHVPSVGFHDAATGLHRMRTARMAIKVVMMDTAMRRYRMIL